MSTMQSPHVEFIFHGTGTSGSVPTIHCLTAPKDQPPCETCLSTRRPEGKKNIRRNTGAVLRVTSPDSEKATIVIDVGKNFLASALEWFPKYALRKIDAVLITHAHADAMNGLDDLRGWTLEHAIQSHIDIYVSSATFKEVNRSFPYLVSKEFASGGGDVPQFVWHTIEANQPFIIEGTGIEITPFAVHHGRLFSPASPPAWLPTPASTQPSTPRGSEPSTPPKVATQLSPDTHQVIHPYFCLGFVMLDIVYMSDVSYIPEDAWATIESARKRPYSLFVVDCLRPRPHTSHFGLDQAVKAARRLGGAKLRTFFVGFGHELPHSTWIAICEMLGRPDHGAKDRCADEVVRSAVDVVEPGPPIHVKPAHDGLRLCFDDDGLIFQEDE